MRFYRSKFFVVCISIAIIMVLVPAVLTAFGRTDIIRSGLQTVAKPFAFCAGKVADAAHGFVSVFADYDDLVKENQELRDRIDELENNSSENQKLKDENKWLKEFLSLRQSNPSLSLADANIISHEAGNHATVLTLNRGTVHGIKKNYPVITSDGVLGYVSEVGLDWCHVVSIIDSNTKTSVLISRSGDIATLEGSPQLRLEGLCMISCDTDADIKIGDRIVTSGAGSSIYPNGLSIGRVVDIEADESTRRLIATVQPSVDFSSLTDLHSVMIVCGYVGHTDQESDR